MDKTVFTQLHSKYVLFFFHAKTFFISSLNSIREKEKEIQLTMDYFKKKLLEALAVLARHVAYQRKTKLNLTIHSASF